MPTLHLSNVLNKICWAATQLLRKLNLPAFPVGMLAIIGIHFFPTHSIDCVGIRRSDSIRHQPHLPAHAPVHLDTPVVTVPGQSNIPLKLVVIVEG